MRDAKNNMDMIHSLAPAVYSTDQDEAGAGADLLNFDGAVVAFMTGVLTDGVYAPRVQESEDNSNWTDVVSSDLEGTLSALSANAVQRVGYKGTKRYIRPVVNVSSATLGGALCSVVARAIPHHAPAA